MEEYISDIAGRVEENSTERSHGEMSLLTHELASMGTVNVWLTVYHQYSGLNQHQNIFLSFT